MARALLVLKSLHATKSRLEPVLGLEQRQALSTAMARDVIQVLADSQEFDQLSLLAGCKAGQSLGEELGLETILDSSVTGDCLNSRVRGWVRMFDADADEALLILHADLPHLQPQDLHDLMQHPDQQGVTIATDRWDRGSNAILFRGERLAQFAWGEDSLRQHQALCKAQHLSCRVLRAPGFARDIDTPADLRALCAPGDEVAPPGEATQALLRDAAFVSSIFVSPGFIAGKEKSDPTAMVEPLGVLTKEARNLRDNGFANAVSYSRKVFIPLTRLCRDVCHYCTFATTPSKLDSPYLSLDEVLAICRDGVKLGCTEALFTLGERPELRYSTARRALKELGFDSTPAYVRAVAQRVIEDTGMLPHLNLGNLSREEIRSLRPVSASMGIMLESASARLCEPDMPHHGSPDKNPERRLRTLELMGEERVPVTTGILIGIGETREERIHSLLAIRELHQKHGHIQELIVQNFRAKPGTRMASAPEPDLDELCWTIAVARLIFGSRMSIQAPPNLSPGVLPRLLDAGINDWGGVSPLTPDHVNPEAPWPHLADLEQQTAQAGKSLVPRLPVYAPYLEAADTWIDPGLRRLLYEHADASGLARDCEWRAGLSEPGRLRSARSKVQLLPRKNEEVRALIAAVTGKALDTKTGSSLKDGREASIARLFALRGDDLVYLLSAADELRAQRCGNAVSYVVNRNINYTNVCSFNCRFCAFSKSASTRGEVYDLSAQELARRAREAWDRGATEICLQGGIHPGYTGETYLEILDTVLAAAPQLHVHAFSPLEVSQGASTLNISIAEFLGELKRRGLGSLPGTAAEILHDEVREVICPDKLSSSEWLAIVDEAHRQGLATTSTIMFGHVDTPRHWAAHLLALRAQQQKSGGFTEFVPLPFVAGEAPLYRRGGARPGPTYREALLMHAVARLVLDGEIQNIQASWVKMGVDGVADCLRGGANDIGGSLMNESITRAAGAAHGEEWSPQAMQSFLTEQKREPWQRSSLYQPVSDASKQRSLRAAPLLIPLNDRAGAQSRSKRL